MSGFNRGFGNWGPQGTATQQKKGPTEPVKCSIEQGIGNGDSISYLAMEETQTGFYVGSTGWDGYVSLWSCGHRCSQNPPSVIFKSQPDHGVPLLRCCFSLDGKKLFCSSVHGKIYEYDTEVKEDKKTVFNAIPTEGVEGLITGLKYIDSLPASLNGFKTTAQTDSEKNSVSESVGNPGLLICTANALGDSRFSIIDIRRKMIVHTENIGAKAIDMDFNGRWAYLILTRKKMAKIDLGGAVGAKPALEIVDTGSIGDTTGFTRIGVMSEVDGYLVGCNTGQVHVSMGEKAKTFEPGPEEILNHTDVTAATKSGEIWPTNTVACHRDRNIAITGNMKGEIYVWSWNEGGVRYQQKIPYKDSPITAICCCGDFYAFAHGYDWGQGAEEMNPTRYRPSIYVRELKGKSDD